MTDSSRGYLRHPHLHGDVVAFVAEDDVWLAPVGGGRAWRLTADQVPVGAVRFSPDGRTLAWTSGRDGAPEVHVVPVAGGQARRLTYWGSPYTAVVGWTGDGRPIAISTAGQETIRRTWAFAVPLDGGEPERLPYGPIGALAFEPVPEGAAGGRVLLGTHNREAAHWKRYRGGRAGKLWIGAAEFERLHAGLNGQLESPMWVGHRVAFLSDHEGVGRLYSSLPDGSDLRAHGPADTGFYARQASTDGTRVIWQSAGELWLLDDLDGAEARRLEIDLAGPRSSRRPHPTRADGQVESAAVDRTGRAAAVVVRGTVHWVTHREGPSRVLDETPGVRGRLARVVPGEDGAQGAVWVTDADGDDAIEYAPAVLGAERRRLAAGQLGRVLALTVSPDGRQLAVASHDGRLLLVALSDGAVHELARSGDGEVSGLVFSPDSGWLAWSQPVLGPWSLRQIMLADLTSRTVSEATPQRFHDYSPAFTSDGKHLAFLSVRTFDPVYDQHVFDLSFPGGTRPFLLTLAADTPSPFGPQRAGRPVGGEDEETKDGDKNESAVPSTRVDLEGLADRIVPFPVRAGQFGALRAAKDGVLWSRVPLSGELGDSAASLDDDPAGTVLERYDLKKRRVEELLTGVDTFAVSGDGARLAVLEDGGLRIVPADQKADDDEDAAVDLDRIRVTVDPTAEWRQMFDENGRLMRDNFWRADLGGVDWAGVLERYRPLVDRAGCHSDLVDLLWETVGELGTSHAYVVPPGRGTEAARRQGLLGADLVRDGEVWRVARVVPGESSDPRARSPLAAPGVAIRPGDAILAVNGRPVDPVTGPGPLLAGTADQPVELTVSGKDGGERHPVVVPLDDEEALRYHDWVAGRRAAVRELSGGRLGYLHVPDMQSLGWAQLHRDLRIEMARDGVLVDLRENRGGHTSQLVVEKLARRIVGWNRARDLDRAEPYPADAPRGPVVALANEFSGSDGDIVNAAIQALGIGPVVGTRTWGGVIGIDNKYDLVDGTVVTQPKYSSWLEGYGWGLENGGVTPDIEVPIAPHDWAAGRDPQLETAVRVALEALERTPVRTAPPID
ncbi:S41 family peptidase [Kitasatospora cheerisanensis]|uniref:Tricorn protease homolog n=1 Tax=Kitasatospora cheerisanensis KCTC 2395 TaxID=1348663 RepID=A0A066YW42_9ACTN|nr:S41 family peptidase [Kitasatospora cheerisanensis]KDN85472.1 peptidase S41 [Kitasatospora cheerisanensis KCTC 2395]